MIITTERGIPMEKFETCPVCKGSGREDHTHMREDGETVVEKIPCEHCKGTGRIRSYISEMQEQAKAQVTRPADGFGGGVDTSSFGFNNDFGDNY